MKVGNGRQALRYVLSPLFITVLECEGGGSVLLFNLYKSGM